MGAKDNVRTEYIMFVDETNPTNSCENFCIAGLIVKRKEYEDSIVKQTNSLKTDVFGITNVILHSTEVKRRKNSFDKLNNKESRISFYEKLKKIYSDNDITLLAVYFHKKKMKDLYQQCTISDYDVAFKHLLENFVHFLNKNNGDGMVVVESRTFNQNSRLQKTFYNYLNLGSDIYNHETIEKSLKCLGFIVKGDNCIGLQLVDFIPSLILKNICIEEFDQNNTDNKKKQTDHYNLCKTIKNKIYYNETDYYNILGVKNLFGK